jgi:hypothetical protein
MRRRRFLQILAFILASILEVSVKAQEVLNFPETLAPIQVPENCLIESSVCTLKTAERQKYTLKMEGAEIVLSANSTFARLSAHSGSVINGYVFLKVQDKFHIETPYGGISGSDGEYLVYQQDKHVLVRNLTGQVTLEPRGHETSLPVEKGFENWMGRVDVKGLATIGIPHSLDYNSMLKDVAPIYPGTKKDFTALMKDFRPLWQDAVHVSAQTDETLVQREIARQKDQQKQRELAQRKWQEERDYLRSILMKKTFE